MVETDRLSELEALLGRVPSTARSALLDAITGMFVDGGAKLTARQVSLFERLFNPLLAEADPESVAKCARRLAPLANAPTQTIGTLAASDDIAVAEPVLARSPRVADAILAQIARNKSQTHLLAIAIRPQIPAAVVDILIERGDEVAVRYVANNRGAQISEAAAAALVQRAARDDMLAELVGKRTDIPSDLRKAVTRKTAAA